MSAVGNLLMQDNSIGLLAQLNSYTYVRHYVCVHESYDKSKLCCPGSFHICPDLIEEVVSDATGDE